MYTQLSHLSLAWKTFWKGFNVQMENVLKKQVDGNTLIDERMENFANPNGKFAALKTARSHKTPNK